MTIMTAVQETTHTIDKGVRSEIEDVRHTLSVANRRATRYVQDNPGTSLLVALAVGWIVGRMAGR